MHWGGFLKSWPTLRLFWSVATTVKHAFSVKMSPNIHTAVCSWFKEKELTRLCHFQMNKLTPPSHRADLRSFSISWFWVKVSPFQTLKVIFLCSNFLKRLSQLWLSLHWTFVVLKCSASWCGSTWFERTRRRWMWTDEYQRWTAGLVLPKIYSC